MIEYKRARRERAAPWKKIICWIRGHDVGMFHDPNLVIQDKGRAVRAGGYRSMCVRCGKRK